MLFDRRLIFVTGKGGVGKTTVAVGLATAIAETGRRTLIVEMDAKDSVASTLGVAPFGYRPIGLPLRSPHGELAGMQMNTEDSLREYLRTVARIPFVGRLGPLARTFDFVADAAPGVKEILAVGKVLSDVRSDAWETIVVDAEATGHVLAQVAAPTALRELIKVGAVHGQTGWMLDLLQDPEVTTVAVVTTPEQLAVNESLELVDRLPAEAGINSAVVVVNRLLPALFSRRQAAVLDRLGHRRDVMRTRFGDGVDPLIDAALVAEHRRRLGTRQLERITERSLPTLMIGEYFGDPGSSRGLIDHVADSIKAEIDIEPSGVG